MKKETKKPIPNALTGSSTDLNYDAAFAELEQIARDLQDDRTGLDELSEKVKRAAELLDFCKKKLRATEGDVAKMI